MSDTTRIDVASVQLREAYQFDGQHTRFLTAKEFRIGYEADTDKLVVQKRGSLRVHVIPWANVNGFELEGQAPPQVKPSAGNLTAEQVARARQEAANGSRPAGAGPAGGGGRRARPPQ